MGEVALADARAPLVLALDAGTSSVRAIVYDAAGQAVRGAVARGAVPARATPDGGVEVDADALVACTAGVLDGVAREAPCRRWGPLPSGTACSAWTGRGER
jgi:glycerol kinase